MAPKIEREPQPATTTIQFKTSELLRQRLFLPHTHAERPTAAASACILFSAVQWLHELLVAYGVCDSSFKPSLR